MSADLRNVQAESPEEIDNILTSLRTRGFINFYGMQRFGTSTVPTHVTGLQILQSKWSEALDSILSLREGEHPDCVRARLAWLEDGDVDRALQLMPRRCVAERGIWEFWQKGGRKEDKLSALATVSISTLAAAESQKVTADLLDRAHGRYPGICGRCMFTLIKAISGTWSLRSA